MKEWYEKEAATGRLTVLCACEKRMVMVPVDLVKKGKAGACREPQCRRLAAKMNEG